MTFDADSAHNQTFVVTLAYGTATVDPNHPGVPGIIDPNNRPVKVAGEGTDKANLTDEVERIVRYLNDCWADIAKRKRKLLRLRTACNS